MSGTLPVAALRFREALAGRMLWLLPLHFGLALAAARAMPGPTPDARREAADAAALALAAALGVAAAAVLGAAPLPEERERARGTLVLSALPGPAARVLGTALGTGGALLLLAAALLASALAAVEAGLGRTPPPPRAMVRAASLEGGNADPADPGLHWLVDNAPRAAARFAEPVPADADLLVEARVRIPPGGRLPGFKRAVVRFHPGSEEETRVRVRAAPPVPFRVRVPAGTTMVKIDRERGDFELGLTAEGVRCDAGPRPRALARGLHGLALFAGLAAVAAAALALSTVAGAGVAAAGALALSLLSLFRSTFDEAASMLVHAGAVERAMAAVEAGPAGHGPGAVSATPPALAPLFRVLADVLPDGTRFDLGAVVAANEVPDAGDAGRAAAAGLGLAVLFLAFAVLGARRRP